MIFHLERDGIITLTPSITDYLGTGPLTGTESSNIGRFYPASLTTDVTNGSFVNECGSGTPFTYIGQSFDYMSEPTLTATAKNAAGAITLNYKGDWAKLDDGGISLSYPTVDNAAFDQDKLTDEDSTTRIGLTSTTGTMSRVDNADGTITFTLGGSSMDTFVYNRNKGQINPFTADLTIELTGVSDGEASASDLGSPKLIQPSGNNQRFGRASAKDVYGTQSNIGDSLNLTPSIYYRNDSGDWVLNEDDSCTTYSYTKTDTGLTTTTSDSSPVSISSGTSKLTFTVSADPAPNGGNTKITPTTWPSYLRYDLDDIDQGSDGNLNDDNPSATATYGIFRGDDRFLYWQEAR